MRAMLMLAAVAVAVPDRPDRTPYDGTPQSLILGDWRSGVGSEGSVSVWRFTPTETIWLDNGKVNPHNGFTATYVIDWTKEPATIDLMPRRGGKMLGILKLDGNRLTIGLADRGSGRPTDFGKTTSSQHFTRIKN